MDRQAQAPGEVGKQAEAVAGLGDEQPWPIHRDHLVEQVVEGGRLAGACRAEQEQMGVHLPIEAVERVEGQWPAAAIEEGKAGMPGAFTAPPDRKSVV